MFTLKAPAKINWSLFVLNRRADGYHNILSLIHCIGLYDRLTFDDSDSIDVITDADIQTEENLVFKAAVMLRKHAGESKGARIVLQKEIPVQAGLGGGSSDAACTLKGLNQLWDLRLDTAQLQRLGSELGSDVPFFFQCPLALVEGKGEHLTSLDIGVSYTLLLIKPPFSISTAWAYRKLMSRRAEGGVTRDGMELTKMTDKIDNINLICSMLRAGDISSLKLAMQNDFESIAKETYPLIGRIKGELLKAGANLSLMTGSGSAVFGLFSNKDKAAEAATHFSDYWNRVVDTLHTVNHVP
ncbi:MAG: 4-(cytidine 5'-diphospho)-2-C-methyl-D-erythritol kinase [Dissulfurispiraceae bacterium]